MSYDIPDDITDAIVIASKIVGDHARWIDVKKVALLMLPPPRRKLFSTRDRKTYVQHPNEMERAILSNYNSLTGKTLSDVPPDI